MPTTQSFLTVTPTWSNKKLTTEGSIAVRELVDLRIVGCGTDTSIVFKMSSECGRVDYVKFPNEPGDAWTVDGDDLTATLNMNTALLVAAFAPWGPEDRIDTFCTVASAADINLFATGHKQVGNWMENTDDPVAYSTPLADAIAELTAEFEAHDHDGTDAPKVAHGNLTGAGANSHDQIDAALTGIAITLVTHTSGISTNASNIDANEAAIDILNGAALKKASFLPVDPLPNGTTTTKAIREKLNEILLILKGLA